MPNAGRGVKDDELSAGGWRFLASDVWIWHDGFKNLRHYIPFAQNDWTLNDGSGSSALDFPFDSGTGRVPVRITPVVAGVHKIYKRILVPRDFGIQAPSQPMSIVTRRSSTDTYLKAYLYNATTVDPGVNGVSIDPAVSATWESFALVPTGAYNPGDWMTLLVEYSAAAAGRTVEVADLQIGYKTNRGNV